MHRVLLAAALLVAAFPASAREKTDVVILRNGDHLTGEIKGMERGKLDFNTDDIGRISIEWDKVVDRLTTTHQYEAELRSGDRTDGALSSPADGRARRRARFRCRRSSPSPTWCSSSPWTSPS